MLGNLLFALSVFFNAFSLLLWWGLVTETKAFQEELSGYLGHLIANAEEFLPGVIFLQPIEKILNAVALFLWETQLHL